MRLWKACCALALLLCLGLGVFANPTWTATYPKEGANNGEIVVKGTLDVPKGLKTTNTGKIVVCPAGGGLQTTVSITIPEDKEGLMTWGESKITGLTSGTNYNVRVILILTPTMGAGTVLYQTDNVQSKAK